MLTNANVQIFYVLSITCWCDTKSPNIIPKDPEKSKKKLYISHVYWYLKAAGNEYIVGPATPPPLPFFLIITTSITKKLA